MGHDMKVQLRVLLFFEIAKWNPQVLFCAKCKINQEIFNISDTEPKMIVKLASAICQYYVQIGIRTFPNKLYPSSVWF